MKTFLFISTLLFIAADCFDIRDIRSAEDNSCLAQMEPCKNMMEGASNFVVNKLKTYGSWTRTDLDQNCASNLVPAAKCIETKLETCGDNEQRFAIAASRMMNDACTSDGKRTLMKMQNSPCFRNETQLEQMLMSYVACFDENMIMEIMKAVQKGEGEDLNLCQFDKDLGDCIMNTTYNHCGDGYGKVVTYVLEGLWGDMTPDELGCSTALQAKRYATRALESLRDYK